MKTNAINVFELLDNFFGSQDYKSAETLSNGRIHELHDHVTTFYNAYRLESYGNYHTRLYLGGFLSSPPVSTESAPYLASALLCADSIILFDPLHYWFCDERYQRPGLMSDTPGWKTMQEKWISPTKKKNVLRPNYELTRNYLVKALFWLSNIRPLVDAGIIELVPAAQIVLSEIKIINQFAEGIKTRLAPLDSLSNTFKPDEVTVDDKSKGLFVFAGGNREYQIQQSIGHGIDYFARDIVIANSTGSLYTAPFRWEQYLGKTSLDGFAAAECKTKAVEGIRNLHLPILSNLSSDLIVKIHNDSTYTLFRASLVEALQALQEEIGSKDFIQHVQQIETDIILPKVEAIYKETKSSIFTKITRAVEEGAFAFSQTFLGNAPIGLDVDTNVKASAISGGLSFAHKLLKGIWESRDHRIWAQLLPEKPSNSIYGSPLMLKQQGNAGWDIDPNPSMSIKITSGIIKNFM